MHPFGVANSKAYPLKIARSHWLDGNWVIRTLIEHCLNLIAPHRKLSVKKPLHVEVSAMKRGRSTVVHFLNYCAQKRSGSLVHNEQLQPVRNIQVRLRLPRKPRSVRQLPEARALKFRYRDRVMEFTLPELKIHSAVVVDG